MLLDSLFFYACKYPTCRVISSYTGQLGSQEVLHPLQKRPSHKKESIWLQHEQAKALHLLPLSQACTVAQKQVSSQCQSDPDTMNHVAAASRTPGSFTVNFSPSAWTRQEPYYKKRQPHHERNQIQGIIYPSSVTEFLNKEKDAVLLTSSLSQCLT